MPNYPDIVVPAIGTGETTLIADRIHWLRMPVPGQLESINVWAIPGKTGWVIVDTGLRGTEAAAAWSNAFSGTLSGMPVERVCLTHMHPDHAGMAGWLTSNHDASLWISRLEYFMLRTLVHDSSQEAPRSAVNFYRQAGWSEDMLDRYRTRFGEFGRMIYPLPTDFRALRDGDVLDLGSSSWEIVTGRGHSPEQSLFYNSHDGLLISGDQILPKITSNVSVFPQEPNADPLTDWIDSLAHIKGRVPDDVLVLPSHGRPFYGLHDRIDALLAGHEEDLAKLHEALAKPMRAVDTFEILFRRKIGSGLYGLATGESLAHLSCLRTRGLATDRIGQDGLRWWQQA